MQCPSSASFATVAVVTSIKNLERVITHQLEKLPYVQDICKLTERYS